MKLFLQNSQRRLILRVPKKNLFFANKISDKYGNPCCRYGQDGQPMLKEKAETIFKELKNLLPKWKLNESGKRIETTFYFADYLKALDFVNEVGKLDQSITKNTPSFIIDKGNFLKISLYSPSLDGLSQIDFQLALLISNIPFAKFDLIQVQDENNYEKEAKYQLALLKSENLQKKLKEEEGKK